jgi:hypothetical protein
MTMLTPPVTLRLRCPACQGKIRVTYRPSIGSQTGVPIPNKYQCPFCREMIAIDLPGLVRMPIEQGH